MASADQEPIRLSIKPSLDDWWAFQKEICGQRPKPKSWKRQAALGAAWLAWAYLFFEMQRHEWFELRDLLVCSSGAALVLVVMVVNTVRVRARLTPAPDGSVLRPWDLELSGDGLRIKNTHGEGMLVWPSVREIRETPSHLFLMTDTCTGLIVPKGALNELGTRERVNALLRSHVPERAVAGEVVVR